MQMDKTQENSAPLPALHVLSPEPLTPTPGRVGPRGTGEIATNPTAGVLCAHFLLSPHGTGAVGSGRHGGRRVWELDRWMDTGLEKEF